MSSPLLVTQQSQDASLPTWVEKKELEALVKQISEFRKIESLRWKWETQLAEPALCVHIQVLVAGKKF